jgi:hypothetical protein
MYLNINLLFIILIIGKLNNTNSSMVMITNQDLFKRFIVFKYNLNFELSK